MKLTESGQNIQSIPSCPDSGGNHVIKNRSNESDVQEL